VTDHPPATAPPADDGMKASSRHGAPDTSLLGEQALTAALRVSGPMVFVDNDEHRVHQVRRILTALEPLVATLVAEQRKAERERCLAHLGHALSRTGIEGMAPIYELHDDWAAP
jgi:acetyl/propionyl-CoA carboxylase alpha subunit